MFKAESYVGYKLCWPGDLVINSLWAWARGLGVSRYHGIVSSAYGVYRLRPESENDSQFIHELVRSTPFHWELRVRSKGVWTSRLQLTDESFLGAPFPLPPPIEQSAIVRFLHHANRRIERYIRSKKKLIALLNEQKQAIIHRVVTRGLDPNLRLKPSGIPWLGDIPEHWEMRRLRTLVSRIEQGVSPQAEGFLADDSSWGVLKAGCVNRGVFREVEHKRLPKSFPIDSNIAVRVGDVLVSRASGSPQLVGSVGKVEALSYRLILSDKTFRLTFRNFVNVDFAVYAMNSSYYRYQVEQAISGAEGLANNLPLSSLRDFQLVVPPTEEACGIAVMLRKELRQFDAAMARAEREITLIHEYRIRLVADVVTGQFDAREAAAKLPDEPKEEDVELVERANEEESEPNEFEDMADTGTIG
jgi:type I restriction enzyme S subunit